MKLMFNGFTSDNTSDTSDEEELQSSEKDYKGGEAQGNKDNETAESNEIFDCYTVIDASILQSMLDDFTVCKYCHKELNVFEYPKRSYSLGRDWNFECSYDQCESRFIHPRPMTPKKGRLFQINCDFVLVLPSVGWDY